MNTNVVMNFAKGIDNMIPEATPENVKKQCRTISEDAKNTGMCLVATCMCGSKAVTETAVLGLMVSKTVTKKAFKVAKDWYNNVPSVTIRK